MGKYNGLTIYETIVSLVMDYPILLFISIYIYIFLWNYIFNGDIFLSRELKSDLPFFKKIKRNFTIRIRHIHKRLRGEGYSYTSSYTRSGDELNSREKIAIVIYRYFSCILILIALLSILSLFGLSELGFYEYFNGFFIIFTSSFIATFLFFTFNLNSTEINAKSFYSTQFFLFFFISWFAYPTIKLNSISQNYAFAGPLNGSTKRYKVPIIISSGITSCSRDDCTEENYIGGVKFPNGNVVKFCNDSNATKFVYNKEIILTELVEDEENNDSYCGDEKWSVFITTEKVPKK